MSFEDIARKYRKGAGKTDNKDESSDKKEQSEKNLTFEDIARKYRKTNTGDNVQDKRNKFEHVKDAEDFEQYSQAGKTIANPDWKDTSAPVNIFGWKPFGDGEDINNMVTFAEANKDKAMQASVEAMRSGVGNDNAALVNLINTHMKDEEKQIYNYYIGKGDKKTADEYLEYLKDILTQRSAGVIANNVEEQGKLAEVVFSTAAGLESFAAGVGNIDNYIMGKEGDPTTAMQYAYGQTSSNNEGLFKVVNDLGYTTGNMLPSILVGSVTGGLGGALTMGASATGNAYAEMRKLGYGEWQSRGYATLVGASEAGLQYLLGGISKLGGKVSGNAVSKLVSGLDHALARTAIQLGGNMASEGLEEAIQTVLEPAFKALVTGEEYEAAEWSDIMYSALLGALSAGVLEGAPTIAGTAINSHRANKLYGSDAQALVTEALEIDPANAHAQRMQSRLDKGKNVSGYQINRLVESNEDALVSQDKGKIKAKVKEMLYENRETGNVDAIADVITKIRSGEKITKAESNILTNSKSGRKVSTEMNPDIVKAGTHNSSWVEDIGTERINADVYNRSGEKSTLLPGGKVKTNIIPPDDEKDEKEGKISATVAVKNADGKTVNAEIQSVEVDGDKASFTLSNGEKVGSDNIDFKSDNAKMVANIAVEKVSRVKGFSDEAATAMIKGYDGSISPTQYTMAFDDAFKMGASGVPSSKLIGVINSGVNERVAYTAYELGRQSAEKSTSDLKSLSNNSIINTNESEAKNESSESIHLRNGSKRDGGKNTQGQVSRMESGTGQTESRRKTARIADSEAGRLVNEGREVKVADLGILGGSNEQTVRVVDKANETSSMKEARKRAEARGLKVTFFVGDNLVIKDKSGEWISVRGYIYGEHVFVRADHSLYTADQIMRHELGHDMIAKGEVDIKAVRERLEKTVGKENIDKLAEFYTEAYEGSGMSAEDIWEECICDSLGDMNIFAGNEVIGTFFDTMLPEIKKAASDTKSPTQTRGSPDGKSSRETYTKSQYNNFGWVRANDVVSEGYWDNFTRNYADAVSNKGFDRITPDGEYMIEIYDQNLEERLQVIDHIVFAKGSIKSPNVTKIIQIYEFDENKLNKYRRNIYDFERRGIQQETGELLELHRKTDFGAYDNESYSGKVYRNSQQFGVGRSGSGKAANRVKEYIFEVEESELSGKASRELDTDSTEYKINTSMTMAEAKRMIETAFKVHGIAEYYEGEYANAEDWLKKAGSDEVEMYIENDYDLYAKYIASNEDILNVEYRISDVLDAYLAGTLVGKEKPKPKRLDVSQSTRLKDSRFYSPQKIENAKETFELANQKAVGKDANAINRARAEILLFSHNKGAAELLGITQAELNKKLRSWSRYSATAKNISERINAGVAEENRWTGIENSSYISKARVSNEDIERLVASVEGDSKGYERKYIARVMLAADTHIDYSGLKFKFASSQQVNADNHSGGSVLGFYDDTNKLIEITHDKPHTVAHEMGHYIDAQWGRDLVGSTSSHLFLTRGVNEDVVRERYGEPGVQFLNNFKLFINSLSDVNQNYNSYYNDRKEIFARFFARFIEWTDNIATGNKYYSYESTMYNDKFTQAQYVEFARLLQEKALLDGSVVSSETKTENGQPKFSRELDFIDFINEQAGEESDPNLTKAQNAAKARGELEKMNVGKGEIMAVMKLADKMFDVYGGDRSISEFRYGLFEATKLALNGSETGFDAAYDIIHTLAKEVAYNPKNVGGEAELLAEIKRDIRGSRMSVHEADKTSGEFYQYGGYGAFRKSHLGKFMLANDGIQADVKYEELQNLYGKSFFPDLNTVSEQLMRMAELMDTPLSEYMMVSEAELEATADEMVQSLFARLGDIWSRAIKSGKTIIAPSESDKVSNRSLLVGALETAAQNDIERNKLEQYKAKIDLINAEEQKLFEIRTKIKELSFAKGPRDTEAIKKLQLEANQAANRINTYDRQLLNLESTKALKGVLEREKTKARKIAEKKGKEALERQRERAEKAQRELMDRYQESRKRGVESRNKTAMRHKIKDVVNNLNNYLLKGTKEKHVPIELQKAVAEALDAVNMDTVGAEERIAKLKAEMMSAKTPEAMQEIAKKIEHIEEMGGNMEAKLSRLKAAYDSIINSTDPLIANSHDEVISNTIQSVMKEVEDTPLRDMSLYQLEAVYDMYKMVLHSVRTANKAFKAKKSEEISVIANRVMEEVDNLGKKKKLQTKTGEAISSFDWNNQKPIYAFERIGSDTFKEVFENVRAGEDTWAVDMSEAQEFLVDKKAKHNYDSWDFDKRYDFTSSTGKKFSLSIGQIMSLYAYSKRGDQAKDHLRNGGFVFDGLTEVKEKGKLGVTKTYRLKDSTAYNLSDEILADIISKLTSEQKAFADVMQEYLSTTMGEKGNEVSLELYGVKLFKEKDYFPLKSAPQFLERAREQAQGEVKIKNKGFTKETTPKAINPIVLTSFMDVWAGHVNEMSMYHSFTLALEDFYRVYNYKTPASETLASESVISFLEDAHGNASVSYIDQLLKDLNGGVRNDSRESVAKSLMSKFKKASVIASLSVVIQQPSAIVRAQALVDAKYFIGKNLSKGKHKEIWAEVKKYAPVAIIKEMGYFDVGMGQSSVEWLKGEKSLMDKIDDFLSKAPAFADELTWVAIWNAVKRETAHNNPTLRTNSEEFLKLAGDRFTEVIVKTQVYDSTLARSANMRSKSAFMSMFTAFMAEPTTSINMLQDAFKKGNKKQIARTIGAVYGSVVLNSALVALVYAMRDDDEDETFLEKYLSSLTTEILDGINPLTYIPGVKDVWSLAQGYDVERADMTLISKLLDSLKEMATLASKDTSGMDEEELREHNKAWNEAFLGNIDNISSLLGIPVKNIRRDINGIINGVKTIIEDAKGRETTSGSLGDNILDDVQDSVPVWGWFPNESKGDKLYEAIIKGDTAYVDRLKSGYKSDSAYNSAIRKALRENDPRIKEAAEAYLEGDYATYNALREEIVAEGVFDRKLVTDALKAEYNYLKKKANED